jgi:hypothetical protein
MEASRAPLLVVVLRAMILVSRFPPAACAGAEEINDNVPSNVQAEPLQTALHTTSGIRDHRTTLPLNQSVPEGHLPMPPTAASRAVNPVPSHDRPLQAANDLCVVERMGRRDAEVTWDYLRDPPWQGVAPCTVFSNDGITNNCVTSGVGLGSGNYRRGDWCRVCALTTMVMSVLDFETDDRFITQDVITLRGTHHPQHT